MLPELVAHCGARGRRGKTVIAGVAFSVCETGTRRTKSQLRLSTAVPRRSPNRHTSGGAGRVEGGLVRRARTSTMCSVTGPHDTVAGRRRCFRRRHELKGALPCLTKDGIRGAPPKSLQEQVVSCGWASATIPGDPEHKVTCTQLCTPPIFAESEVRRRFWSM